MEVNNIEDFQTPPFLQEPAKPSAPEPGTNPFLDGVDDVLGSIKDILIRKNAAYGNSALEPMRIFSKANNIEQLKVRIDDKLSRLSNGSEYGDEDTVTDLIGYLVLLKIAQKHKDKK